MSAWPSPLLWSLTMVCLTGESSRHRVSVHRLRTEVGKATMGVWEPWASPTWGAAVGRAGGRQGRKEVLKDRQCWKWGASGECKHLLLQQEKEKKMRNSCITLHTGDLQGLFLKPQGTGCLLVGWERSALYPSLTSSRLLFVPRRHTQNNTSFKFPWRELG